MKKNMLVGFIKSFGYASRGIWLVLSERSIKIQLGVAVFVTSMGIYFSLSTTEWVAIILAMFVVLAAETINSAVESVCDIVKDVPGVHSTATRDARDIAAGSVLLISIGAFVVGFLVFWPKVIDLLL
jgi:diacylglycerol kinase (ATP)